MRISSLFYRSRSKLSTILIFGKVLLLKIQVVEVVFGNSKIIRNKTTANLRDRNVAESSITHLNKTASPPERIIEINYALSESFDRGARHCALIS